MIPLFYARARFIGTDGSMGYIFGQDYLLEIRQAWMGAKITIAPVDPERCRTLVDMTCPYDSLELFAENWQMLGIANGPTRWKLSTAQKAAIIL